MDRQGHHLPIGHTTKSFFVKLICHALKTNLWLFVAITTRNKTAAFTMGTSLQSRLIQKFARWGWNLWLAGFDLVLLGVCFTGDKKGLIGFYEEATSDGHKCWLNNVKGAFMKWIEVRRRLSLLILQPLCLCQHENLQSPKQKQVFRDFLGGILRGRKPFHLHWKEIYFLVFHSRYPDRRYTSATRCQNKKNSNTADLQLNWSLSFRVAGSLNSFSSCFGSSKGWWFENLIYSYPHIMWKRTWSSRL